MQVTLSDEDARGLRDFLHDHFRELQLEIARTDRKEFRKTLVARRAVIERVLSQLERVESVQRV